MFKSILSTFSLAILATTTILSAVPARAQAAPQKAYFNIINNSGVDLQYYGCDGATGQYLNYESEGGIYGGTFNDYGLFLQPKAKTGQTTSLSISQGFNPQTAQQLPLPGSLTLKFATGIAAPAEAIKNICTSTNTVYIKSITVAVNPAAAAADITITGTGNTATSTKGLVNGTYIGNNPGYDYTQELQNPLQYTTSQAPKVYFSGAVAPNVNGPGTPVDGKVCVDGVVTNAPYFAGSQFTGSGSIVTLTPNSSPVLRKVNSDLTTCNTTASSVTLASVKSNFIYDVSGFELLGNPNIYNTSGRFVPYTKGVYLNSVTAGTPNTYTNQSKVCVDNVVTNEVATASSYMPVATGVHTLLPVNTSNACDTTATPYSFSTPANSYSSLSIVNVHDKTLALNATLSVPATAPVQQPTIQTTVTTPLPTSGPTSIVDNYIGTTMLLERDLSGNLSIKESNAGTAGEDLLSLDMRFNGLTLPSATTVSYKPITNNADLTASGEGLPVGGTQLTQPFELVLTPKPTNVREVTVSFNAGSLSKPLSQINTANLKAYASNSPFQAYPVTITNGVISTTIPGGFKQLSLYEVAPSSTTGLIRTGGQSEMQYFVSALTILGFSALFTQKLRKN
jgi:hypothetical protein